MRDYPTLLMEAAEADGARVYARPDEPGGWSIVEGGEATFLVDMTGEILSRAGSRPWRNTGAYTTYDQHVRLAALADKG